MKIVYYTDQLYLHGGIEKMLTQKLNYFVKQPGFEVHLITTEQKGNQFCYPISEDVIHYDLGVNYERTKSYFSSVNLRKVPKHIKKLNSKLNGIEPDILVACNYAFDFYFIPFISGKIKAIKEYHSSRYDIENRKSSTKGFLMFRIDEFINSKYDKIAVLNKDEEKHYTSNNTIIIPNSISTGNEIYKNQRENTIIAAGRIAPVKQFDHLIKAWSIIAKDNPDWKVNIYGDGSDVLEIKLKTLIQELEVPNIRLVGATSNLDRVMQKSSIFALTSATECFPMVLLESLKNGLPIVSYDCPYGPRNIIRPNDDGVLVEHNDIESFADALSEMINDKKFREQMEDNTIKNSKYFAEEIIMQKWLSLFEELNSKK